jgi:nucleotide-binding universal stress UspA family protein
MTVAVAYQVSPTGRVALRRALDEAKVRDAALAVVHVVEAIDADNTEAYRLGISDEIERVVGSDCPVRWDLHLATPTPSAAEAVLNQTEEVGAEILVIGARRRSPVGKALLGSVAQTIILDANVPVLVVKAP